eukprot:3834230-Prymnesium_polylepis.2
MLRYGSDIAERFYVSPDNLVRGTFNAGNSGAHPQWLNKPDEISRDAGTDGYCLCFGCTPRWRPPRHGVVTPLWRLDKLIAFPWRQLEAEGPLPASFFREQMHSLVMRQQHLGDERERMSGVVEQTRESEADGTTKPRDLLERLADRLAPSMFQSTQQRGESSNATPLLPA